jgi:hypothetical protein
MSDFVVRIDTAKLDEKQAAAIAGAIQGAVFSELGKLDLEHGPGAPAGASGSIIFHPEWRGIWIRDLRKLQEPNQPVLTVQTR